MYVTLAQQTSTLAMGLAPDLNATTLQFVRTRLHAICAQTLRAPAIVFATPPALTMMNVPVIQASVVILVVVADRSRPVPHLLATTMLGNVTPL